MKRDEEFRFGRRRTNALYRTVSTPTTRKDSRNGTLGFVSNDEAYAIAMLAVVKAHQSRAEIGGKISPREQRFCTDCWHALIFPRFFRDHNNTNSWLVLSAKAYGICRRHR